MSIMSSVKVHYAESATDIDNFMRWMYEQDLVAIDTETTGLSPETDTVRLVQFGNADDAWVLRADRWAGAVEDVLTRWPGEYIAHNAKFDVAMIRTMLGTGRTIPVERCHDTRILAHLLEPDLPSGLKNAASRHVDPSASALDRQLAAAYRSAGWSWDTVPYDFQPYWAYAGVDTILTFRLFKEIYDRAMVGASKAYKIELGSMWVLERMERNGVLVDVERAQEVKTKLDAYVKQASDWCKAEYGVSPGANADVARILMEAGFQLDKSTASGATALDREVLEGISHPLADTVLSRRQAQKISSTYLKHFLNQLPGGRLHPSINPLGARTGRMSMSNPNFQNLPRDSQKNPAGKAVRDCIVAGEDASLVSCDFSQIEFRILAHLSGDRGLIEAFSDKDDFFTVLARNIYNDPTIIKSDPRRQPTKSAGYAKLYGAGADTFGKTAGIPAAEAHQIMSALDRSYPGIHNLQQQIMDVAREREEESGVAYVVSPISGRRHPSEPGKAYTLVNYLVQGMASEVFKKKLIELDLAGLSPFMLLPVHDEVVCEFPDADAEELTHTLEAVMNDKDMLTVPITASAVTGKRWGELDK